MTTKRIVTSDSVSRSIKSLLETFQEQFLRDAIASGKVPQDIESMTKEDILSWYNNNHDGSEMVESAILKILEKNHGMNGYESTITLNQSKIENYLRSIIQIIMGNTCCADKAREVVRDLLKSYSQKTPQYDRDFSHPVIASKRLWKKIVETSPLVTLGKPIEHSRAVIELESLYSYIEKQRDEFLQKFYAEFASNPELLRDGDAYTLAKDLNVKSSMFPLPPGSNEMALVIVDVLFRESFHTHPKNPWHLYQYIHKNSPKSVRNIKNKIKASKKSNKK